MTTTPSDARPGPLSDARPDTPSAVCPDTPSVTGNRPAPAFMLRVAGLPADAVRALRCPGSRRWADEVLDATEQLALLAGKAGDHLHGLIGGSDDEPSRR
ncbi:hypothetical protein G3I27_03760, partial [Streptomyces sp. SID10692]|uniref:hypothetical protein n=1 Tax=Streptomyces sp. SID10692 TaxID=2706026 RepID=UPI0013DA89EA|nr:hypothetical protein [Streptomyces sp. SID10692]